MIGGRAARDCVSRHQRMSRQGQIVRSDAEGPENGVIHRPVVALEFKNPIRGHRVDVFPDRLACGRDFDDVPFRVGADQRIPIGQPLGAAANVTKHGVAGFWRIAPDDLLRH